AGAVVMNREGRALLLRKAGEAVWVLPKGTLEPGETDEEAAVREVHEETGLRVKLLRPLTEVRYAFYWPPDGVNVDKTVAYFLAAPIGGRVRPGLGAVQVHAVRVGVNLDRRARLGARRVHFIEVDLNGIPLTDLPGRRVREDIHVRMADGRVDPLRHLLDREREPRMDRPDYEVEFLEHLVRIVHLPAVEDVAFRAEQDCEAIVLAVQFAEPIAAGERLLRAQAEGHRGRDGM